MAITFEEKTSSSGIINFLIWVVILIIIVASAYYVFFKNPQFVEFTASTPFKNVQQLSKITINSDQLINSPQFQSLKQYITVTAPQDIGRANPFLGF